MTVDDAIEQLGELVSRAGGDGADALDVLKDAVRDAPWLLPEHIIDGAGVRELLAIKSRATLISLRERDPSFPQPIRAFSNNVELWDLREVESWRQQQR